MTTTNQNVTIYRGDSARLNVTLTTATGEPYTPLGDSVRYRIARNAHSPDSEAYINKDLGAGLTIAAGVATIDLSSTETAALELGLYNHSIKVTDPPSDRYTVMTGTVVIKA